MPNRTQQPTEVFQIEGVLPSEWTRLVRLCAHFTGDHDAAEDLAQETLIEAWRHQDRVYDWQGYSSWLSAIARNLSLRWIRQRRREQGRLVTSIDSVPETSARAEELAADQHDFTIDLERAELADLLDRALALLPAESRRVLVEILLTPKYKEPSHACCSAPAQLRAALGRRPDLDAGRLAAVYRPTILYLQHHRIGAGDRRDVHR